MEAIRVGRISCINYVAGTVDVVYIDRDSSVTRDLPMLSFQYMMPEVGDMVYVAHLENGSEIGLLLGRYWCDENPPPEGFQGLFRKDLSRTPGKAMIRYDDNTGELQIHSDGPIKITGSRIDLN